MRILTLALPVSLVAAGVLVGCAQKTDETGAAAAPAGAPGKAAGPAVAPEQPARIVGGANSQPTGTSQPTGQAAPLGAGMGQMPPGHPPIGAASAAAPVDPHGAPGATAPVGGGTGGTIKGTITLDPGRAADVKPGSVLYIIVRRDAGEGQRGSLIASKKVEVDGPGVFPLTYEVGPENVMMGGTALDGQIRVEARIDQDGDAISKQPGDVIGARAGAVTVPSGGIDFALAEKI